MKQYSHYAKRDGFLSAYSLACGYVQFSTKLTKETNAKHLRKELYKENNLYFVRQFEDTKTILNKSFYKLSEAKGLYKSIIL